MHSTQPWVHSIGESAVHLMQVQPPAQVRAVSGEIVEVLRKHPSFDLFWVSLKFEHPGKEDF